MERPRLLPNELTDEELLQSLKEQNTTTTQEPSQTVEYVTDTVPFLTHFDIKPGDDIILERLIYDLYKIWSRNPVSKDKFHKDLAKYLIRYQSGNSFYYKVNRDAIHLTHRELQIINSHKQDKTKSPGWKRHFDAFINAHDLKQGTYWVEGFILYSLYDKWRWNTNVKGILGENQFFNFCKLYFEHKRRTDSKLMWFAVSDNIKDHISEQSMNNIRSGRKNAKKIKKKKSKTSST